MMSLPTEVDQEVLDFYYPAVQKDSNPGKWLVMKFTKGEKANKAELVAYANLPAKMASFSAKKKAPYNKRKKALEESKDEGPEWLDVEDDKDAAALGDKAKEGVDKKHHEKFTQVLFDTSKETGLPTIGIIELLTKVFYITYCPESVKAKAKMSFASSRGAIRDKLSTTNVDIQANDKESCSWAECKKKGPKH